MLARCNLCEKTFVTNQFGRQRCPKCGGEVFIGDPRQPDAENAYAPPSTHVGPYAPSDTVASAEGVPWDRRNEIGLWKALSETVKLALTEPASLFSRVRPERTDGLLLYVFLVSVVPTIVGSIIGRLLNNPADQLRQTVALYRQLGQEDTARFVEKLQPYVESSISPGIFIASLALVPVFTLFFLYIYAGFSHLILKLLGKGSAGWNGTFAAYAYALSPGLLILIPGCGSLIMATWVTALQIIGLSKVQRISTGESTIAVLSFHALVLCATCGVAMAAVAVIAKTMGPMQGI